MLGTMGVLLDYVNTDLSSLGITAEDSQLTCGDSPWVAADRNRVTRTIHGMIFGTLEAEGIRLKNVPVEYVAAVINVAVDPCNQLKACVWLQDYGLTGVAASELAAGAALTPVRAEQIFALCILANDKSNSGTFRQQLRTNMNIEIRKVGNEQAA